MLRWSCTRRRVSTSRLSPQCAVFPPRASLTQVPLVQAKYTTAKSPRCICLPPRQHCGVRAESKCTCFPPSATSTQVPLIHVQVHRDMDSGYLSEVGGVLGFDSGYLSVVGQVNIPNCSTYNYINPARRACALRALGLLLADGAPTVGRGKTFWRVN